MTKVLLFNQSNFELKFKQRTREDADFGQLPIYLIGSGLGLPVTNEIL